MLENGTQNQKEIRQNGYAHNLKDVVEKDYWSIQMLLHEDYGDRSFNPNRFNDLLNGLRWLKTIDGKRREEVIKGEGENIPKFAHEFHFTINLFLELEHEIQNFKDKKTLEVPVAYGPEDKEKLRNDLEDVTSEPWYKFKDDPEFKDPDALCARLLRSYWTRLKIRALLERAGGNR